MRALDFLSFNQIYKTTVLGSAFTAIRSCAAELPPGVITYYKGDFSLRFQNSSKISVSRWQRTGLSRLTRLVLKKLKDRSNGHGEQKFRIVFETGDECSANGLAMVKTKAKNFIRQTAYHIKSTIFPKPHSG
jgi:hypothetical protein